MSHRVAFTVRASSTPATTNPTPTRIGRHISDIALRIPEGIDVPGMHTTTEHDPPEAWGAVSSIECGATFEEFLLGSFRL